MYIIICKVDPGPGLMHDIGCSGLVHWDDPGGWDGEGGGKGGEVFVPCLQLFTKFDIISRPKKKKKKKGNTFTELEASILFSLPKTPLELGMQVLASETQAEECGGFLGKPVLLSQTRALLPSSCLEHGCGAPAQSILGFTALW